MRNAADLVAAFPDITFVLVHAGMLESDAPEARQAWLEGMKRLADHPNVVAKISGQGTFLHRVDAAFIARVIHDCFALFGSERCMFGSNLPIETLWTDFGALWKTYQDAVAGYPESDRNNLFSETARRVYAL
jgi:predicted TIM-barrel fold metal-dependent hydrolase